MQVGRGAGGGGGGRAVAGGSLTPLMIAARANQLDAMKLLVAGGADPSLRADNGTSTLMYASGAKLATVKYAYEIDPNVDVVNQSGQTPIHASVSGGVQRTQDEIVEVIQFLADKGAKLDEIDAAGRTAISLADSRPDRQGSRPVDGVDSQSPAARRRFRQNGNRPAITTDA